MDKKITFSSENELGRVWLTPHQKQIDSLALSLLEHPAVKAARDHAEARFRASPEFSVADAPATLTSAVDNLLFSSLQIAANLDPSRPGIIWTVRLPYASGDRTVPDSRYGGDNPDRVYRLIGVDPEYRYEIRGRRHPTHPSPGELYFEAVRAPGLFGQPLIALHSHNIDVDADGTFTISADATPSNGRRNHLYLPPGASNIVVRDTLMAWARQLPNEITVKTVGGSALPERSRDEVACEGAALFGQSVDRHLGFLQFCCREQPANQLLAFERPVHWGVGGGLFAANRFELGDDEALVLTLDLLSAPYFNIAACDPWSTSVDYASHISSLNNIQAQPDEDGRYTFALAARDPGVHNWLDTGGLHTGVLVARWDPRSTAPLVEIETEPNSGSSRVWAPEKAVEAAVSGCRVLKLGDVPSAVPAGQARVNPDQRRRLQWARQAEHRVRMTGRIAAES